MDAEQIATRWWMDTSARPSQPGTLHVGDVVVEVTTAPARWAAGSRFGVVESVVGDWERGHGRCTIVTPEGRMVDWSNAAFVRIPEWEPFLDQMFGYPDPALTKGDDS